MLDSKIAVNMAHGTRIFGISRGAAFVNIKVAVVKWLQKHSFDAEYTIRQSSANLRPTC